MDNHTNNLPVGKIQQCFGVGTVSTLPSIFFAMAVSFPKQDFSSLSLFGVVLAQTVFDRSKRAPV